MEQFHEKEFAIKEIKANLVSPMDPYFANYYGWLDGYIGNAMTRRIIGTKLSQLVQQRQEKRPLSPEEERQYRLGHERGSRSAIDDELDCELRELEQRFLNGDIAK